MEATQCLCRTTITPVTVDNEYVCSGCGQVFGYEDYQEKSGVSKVNLYLRTANGGEKVRLLGSTKKLHIHNTDNGKISDICDKLSINSAMQYDVLNVYKNVLKMKFSKATAACFAVYYVCRSNGFPFDEKKVMDVVCMAFGVQSAPTMLSAIVKVNKATDMTGNAWFATMAGNNNMPTTTEANPSVFYLRKHVQMFYAKHPEISFNYLYRLAMKKFERLGGGNAETRAKKAVKLATLEANLN